MEDLTAYAASPANRQLLFEQGPRLAGQVHLIGRLDHARLRLMLPCWSLAVFPSIIKEASPLVFEEVDREAFTLFHLGERAGREGGTSPAVYNAANEFDIYYDEGISRTGEILDLGRLLWQYRTQYQRYVNSQLWTVPCLAGQTIGVIEPDGALRACELRDKISSLASSGWNFGAQWYGSELSHEVRQIRADRCDCTHVCFVQSSRDHSLRATFLEAPRLWLRYRQRREWL